MKYLLFTISMLGIVPAATVLLCRPRWIRWTVPGLFLPLLAFDASAINFFSHEWYRGTARGMEISVIYILAAVLLLTFSILKGKLRFFPDAGSRIYLLYFLFCIPSLINAENLLFSFFELWKMAMAYLVFLAVYRYLEYSGGDFDILLSGFAAVVTVSFLVVVREHFTGVYQVRGVFPHQNSLAMAMIPAGSCFFACVLCARPGCRLIFLLAAFAAASVSLIRTYSRGALVCYPASCALTVAASFYSSFSLRKIKCLMLLLLIGAAGFLLFLPRIAERFEKAPESSGESRRNYAAAALNMIRDKPLAGVGLNNWGIKINPPYSYSRHRDPVRGYTADYKDGIVETIYLLTAAECGIPCLILLLIWFGHYWLSAWRLLTLLRHSAYEYIPAGMLGGLTGVLLQSVLEWVLKQQINFLWMMIFFAMISYLNKHARNLTGPQTA